MKMYTLRPDIFTLPPLTRWFVLSLLCPAPPHLPLSLHSFSVGLCPPRPIRAQPSCNVLSRFDPCGGKASEAANWHCYAYNCPSTRLAEFQNVTWTAQVGYALYSIIVWRTCEHTSIVH